jgi:hypothetical protein
VPYGYTLSIWGGGGVAIHALGPPSLVDALLYVAGGAIGFFTCEVVAHGDLRPHLRPPAPPPVMAGWGAVHFLPAGIAVLGAAAAAGIIGGTIAWPIAGFAVTVSYLMLSALQATLASRP